MASITDIHKSDDNILHFTLKNADVCVANELRRTLIGNIK